MSDWHFGIDYDMWLYPPVDWTAPDYDYELPEPIEAASIEGTLLVNAEDAIEQVRRLQAENAKLQELMLEIWRSCPVSEDDCAKCPHHIEESDELWCDIPFLMEGLGVEVD